MHPKKGSSYPQYLLSLSLCRDVREPSRGEADEAAAAVGLSVGTAEL